MPTMDRTDAVTLLREVNDRLRAQQNGSRTPVRFVCECGDPDCRRTVVLSADAFDARRRAAAAPVLAHPAR
jgi:hypothetical protein